MRTYSTVSVTLTHKEHKPLECLTLTTYDHVEICEDTSRRQMCIEWYRTPNTQAEVIVNIPVGWDVQIFVTPHLTDSSR